MNILKRFQKKSEGETVTLKIEGMHCTSCALNIDGGLEDEVDGVISSHTNYAKSQTVVTFDPEKVDLQQIREKIEALGYQMSEMS